MQEENPNGTTIFLLGWLSKTGLISFSKLSKEKHLSINNSISRSKKWKYLDIEIILKIELSSRFASWATNPFLLKDLFI